MTPASTLAPDHQLHQLQTDLGKAKKQREQAQTTEEVRAALDAIFQIKQRMWSVMAYYAARAGLEAGGKIEDLELHLESDDVFEDFNGVPGYHRGVIRFNFEDEQWELRSTTRVARTSAEMTEKDVSVLLKRAIAAGYVEWLYIRYRCPKCHTHLLAVVGQDVCGDCEYQEWLARQRQAD